MAKETKVSKKGMVTVYGTGNSKYIAAGAEKQVHKVAAEKLIQLGHVSYTQPEEGKGKGRGKTKVEGE